MKRDAALVQKRGTGAAAGRCSSVDTFHPPPLGAGVVWVPGLEPLLEPGAGLVDVVEIEPQTLWYYLPHGRPRYRMQEAAVEYLTSLGRPILVHGVGGAVGGTCSPPADFVATLAATIERLGAPWASEHLSYTHARFGKTKEFAGFMLPPLQTTAGVAAAASTIRRVASQLAVPFAVETPVNYLKPRSGELSDGEFVAEVVRRAECGILLDLHNVWANEKNGRQPVSEFVDAIPLEHVWELHLGGGVERNGYWLDAHSGPVPDDVLNLAESIIPRLPHLGAVVFEILPPFIADVGLARVADQIALLRQLWRRTRGPREQVGGVHSTAAGPPRSSIDKRDHIAPSDWERCLAALAIGRPASGALADELREDRGVSLIRELSANVRAGNIVEMMGMTAKLLIAYAGTAHLGGVIADYSRETPPCLFASEEAYSFANYLCERSCHVPYLREIVAFDIAKIDAVVSGETRTVVFSREPHRVLEAVSAGTMPGNPAQGTFLVDVSP